jgi:hypothetical protein
MNKQLHTFNGMAWVKEKYTDSGMTDTEFAKHISELTGHDYSCAQVRQYRASLGIPNNKIVDQRDHKIIQVQNALNAVWVDLQRYTTLESLRMEDPSLVAQYEEAMK